MKQCPADIKGTPGEYYWRKTHEAEALYELKLKLQEVQNDWGSFGAAYYGETLRIIQRKLEDARYVGD